MGEELLVVEVEFEFVVELSDLPHPVRLSKFIDKSIQSIFFFIIKISLHLILYICIKLYSFISLELYGYNKVCFN